MLLSSMISFAQSDTLNLPKYYVVDGDTLGITLSIEQCQKLDHNTELLDLYRKMSIDCDNVEKGYIVIVNKLGDKIAILELDVKNLKSQNELQRDQIANLQKQIDDHIRKENLSQLEMDNKDKIIGGLKQDLHKQKVKTALGFGGTVLGVLGFIFLIVGSH